MNLVCVVISTLILKASANVDIFSKCPDFRPVNGFDIEEVSYFSMPYHCLIHFDLFRRFSWRQTISFSHWHWNVYLPSFTILIFLQALRQLVHFGNGDTLRRKANPNAARSLCNNQLGFFEGCEMKRVDSQYSWENWFLFFQSNSHDLSNNAIDLTIRNYDKKDFSAKSIRNKITFSLKVNVAKQGYWADSEIV